jgi:hypothetical protein
MNIILRVFFVFMVFAAFTAQAQQTATTGKYTYVVKFSSAGFDISVIEKLDKQTMDYYRSQSADNEVVINMGADTATIVLLSADKLDKLGMAYNKSAVLKGQVIFNDNGSTTRAFVWKIIDGFVIVDETEY